jgi:superfamily II DNA or RNA helicase
MGIAFVDGTMSSKTRSNEVYAKFRDNDNYKVLLMSDAGAEGFNLSKCKYLIEFDLADSYLIQTQRHGRIERNDSIHDTVFVYQLIAYDSWDEIAQKIIEKKENYDSELIKVLAKN